MHIDILWIVVGIAPYIIKRQKKQGEQVLTAKALFWQLTVCWKKGECSWVLSIPFIEHLGK